MKKYKVEVLMQPSTNNVPIYAMERTIECDSVRIEGDSIIFRREIHNEPKYGIPTPTRIVMDIVAIFPSQFTVVQEVK